MGVRKTEAEMKMIPTLRVWGPRRLDLDSAAAWIEI